MMTTNNDTEADMACNKMSFPTRKAALAERAALQANQIHFSKRNKKYAAHNSKDRKAMSVYECPHCGNYHLTTAKQHRKY